MITVYRSTPQGVAQISEPVPESQSANANIPGNRSRNLSPAVSCNARITSVSLRVRNG